MAVAPGTDLKDIVGDAHVRASGEADRFAVDGVAPGLIVSPGCYQEAADVLRHAETHRLAVIPYGGGAMMHLGNTPTGYGIALDLSRLDAIVEFEPADLTVTCEGGITLEALQSRLATAGQTLPSGPFADRRSTIGGILAANQVGAYVHRHGKPRDLTIGMRVATAGGRLTRAGGRVVKNVAGYDLCKLYIGSLGTLGVIVEATFKVAPLPASERRCTLSMPGARQACSLAFEAERAGVAAQAIELSIDADGCFLTIDLAGSRHAVERSEREIAALGRRHSGRATESSLPPDSRDDASLICRLGVLPTRVPAAIDLLSTMEPPPRVVAWPTAGIIFACWDSAVDEPAAIERLGQGLADGETLVVERCGLATKQQIDVFGDPPPSFPLMRRIKEQFDPNGILSPGRFVGRL